MSRVSTSSVTPIEAGHTDFVFNTRTRSNVPKAELIVGLECPEELKESIRHYIDAGVIKVIANVPSDEIILDPPEKVLKDTFEKYGKKFCSAPWTSLWTSAEGNVKFCCASTQVLGTTKDTFEDIINNPISKEIRLQFLKDEQPETCEQCWEREKAGSSSSSARTLANLQGCDVIQDSLADTNHDTGEIQKHNLKFFDVIWTNKCNFACLHCIPSLSSTIDTSYKEVFSNWLYKSEVNKNWDSVDPDTIDNSNKIEYILKNAGTLDQLHFNGGEPFLQKETFILLDELMKLGYNNKINLWFHTNGGVRSYKNVDIVEDYLKKWGDNTVIIMSHDHYGERGEYFRYGYREDKWLENFNRFYDAGINVKVSTSLTLFNALTMHKLFEWYALNDISTRASIDINNVTGPRVWNFLNLSVDDRLKSLTKRSFSWCYQHFVGQDRAGLREIANCSAMLEMPFDYLDLAEDFVNSIDAIDKKRNTNFIEVFPELEPLYTKLKNNEYKFDFKFNTSNKK